MDQNENPAKGIVNAVPWALALWLLCCVGCLCTGCVVHGSRTIKIELLGQKIEISDHVENDETGKPNFRVDFTNWVQQWIQSFQPPDHVDVTTMPPVGQPNVDRTQP